MLNHTNVCICTIYSWKPGEYSCFPVSFSLSQGSFLQSVLCFLSNTHHLWFPLIHELHHCWVCLFIKYCLYKINKQKPVWTWSDRQRQNRQRYPEQCESFLSLLCVFIDRKRKSHSLLTFGRVLLLFCVMCWSCMLTARAVYDSQLQRVCKDNMETHIPIFSLLFWSRKSPWAPTSGGGLMHIFILLQIIVWTGWQNPVFIMVHI